MDIYGPLETRGETRCPGGVVLFVKFYKNILFSKVCAFLKENFEDDSCVLTLYPIKNGKALSPRGTSFPDYCRHYVFIKEVETLSRTSDLAPGGEGGRTMSYMTFEIWARGDKCTLISKYFTFD